MISGAPAQAAWSRPVALSPPQSLDIAVPEAALSAGGLGAAAFTVRDDDNPANSSAFVSVRNARGGVVGPWQIPGAQAALSVEWTGRTMLLLTGGSPAGNSCCSSAALVTASLTGRFGRPRNLVSGLAGTTAGQLVPLGRRSLAAIATNRGVWVGQSNRSGQWGRTRRVSGAGGQPEAMDATALRNGGGAVGWAGAPDSDVGPRRLFLASGTATRPPDRAHTALTLAGADAIDEVALVPRGSAVTAAWTQAWYDRRGGYHSEAVAEDLRHGGKPVSFPVAGTMASGLAFAADASGDQLLVWQVCTWSGSCSVRAAVRPAGKSFRRPVRLGAIDATEAPALAVSSRGEGMVGWISRGHVLAREQRGGSARFSSAQTVSRTTEAANLALSFGPPSGAFAAWSQDTDVVGAAFRG